VTQVLIKKVLSRTDRIGADANDSDEARWQKTVMVRYQIVFILAALLWGGTYFYFDEWVAGWIPFGYAIVSVLSLILFDFTHQYGLFRFSQLLLTLLLPFLLGLALGGFILSSAVIIWSLTSPLGALMFDELRHFPRWFLGYLSLVIISAFLQPFLRETNNLSPSLVTIFFVMNIGTVSSFVFVLFYHFVNQVRARTAQLVERTGQLSQALDHLQATQSQLVEAEKMAALGQLVAGVAHEINTPVGVGVTAASLLEDKTAAFREIYKSGQMKRTDLEKYLDMAEQSSSMVLRNLQRAAELIQSFKQVAVDQSSEERREFRVKPYLEEILLSLHPQLKKTQLIITINGDEKLTLDSYPGAFAQIVTNLVMNSLIHAYEPQEAGQLTFDFKQNSNHFIFEYNDDGKGIPQENLAKIFDPFFTTKRGQGGSGLGLHIIYNLVTQKLGGTIRCESEVGRGTRFVIETPIP
jgi:signal transduction histidine kinase